MSLLSVNAMMITDKCKVVAMLRNNAIKVSRGRGRYGKHVTMYFWLSNSAPLHEDVWGSRCIDPYFLGFGGRAIAQEVSRWLPTAAARARAWVWPCGICGGKSGAGAGFLRVLRFPLPIFIPPIAPQSPSSIIWGLYNRPEVAAVPSRLSPTPLKKS
jgi:hypothetical protein